MNIGKITFISLTAKLIIISTKIDFSTQISLQLLPAYITYSVCCATVHQFHLLDILRFYWRSNTQSYFENNIKNFILYSMNSDFQTAAEIKA